MPRKPMVTKTIQTTTVTAICLDLTTEQSYDIVYILSGHFRNEQQMQKALEREINDAEHRVVHIKEYTEQSGLFGMTDQEFIKFGHPIPPKILTTQN